MATTATARRRAQFRDDSYQEEDDSRAAPRPPRRSRGWWACRYLTVGAALAALYLLMLWLRENNILLSKPARLWNPRPLLIIGTMASGTQQMSRELGRLGLSVGHESSGMDGGTISWLHGLRVFDDPAGADVGWLCAKPEAGSWHPMMLEPGHCPADGQVGGWGRCWRDACPTVVRRQYGCHLREGRRCLPQFGRTLLQVRHPLATLASCARGFCKGGDAGSDPTGARLLSTARALLPSLPWGEVQTCGGQFALLWAHYYSQAVRTSVDGWYRVEDTPPCAVLGLAGLLNESSSAPDAAKLRAVCAAEDERAAAPAAAGGGASGGAARAQHGYYGRHNTDGFGLTFDDVEMLAGASIRHEIEELAATLGY